MTFVIEGNAERGDRIHRFVLFKEHVHYMPLHEMPVIKWALSSEFVSSSIPSWQVLTAHAQAFRGARDLAFCLKVPLDSLLVWASSGGSGETARMRRLAWTFAARIGYRYQIRLTRSKSFEPLICYLICYISRYKCCISFASLCIFPFLMK